MSELHKRNAIEHGFTPHEWTYGRETRNCGVCGEREQAWDDEEYPINPCTPASERKWRPQYDKPQVAGDHFGDFQYGEAFVVTYHLDEAEREYQGKMVPTVRVSAYFGVERHQSKAVTFLPAEPARYSPVSHVSLERLDYSGEVIEEDTHDNGQMFPLDYTSPSDARQSMSEVMWEWQRTTWDIADFWDGKDMPRD